DQLSTAAAAALKDLPDPWGADLNLALERVATQLGCRLSSLARAQEVSPAPSADSQQSARSVITPCECGYCDDVRYCGPGNSQTSTWPHPHVGSCLNRVCAVHDLCYAEQCVSGKCYWTGASAICDDAFFSGCAKCAGSIFDPFVDRAVCAIAEGIQT